MKPTLSLLLLSALVVPAPAFAGVAAGGPAAAAVAAKPAPTAYTSDRLTSELARILSDHFQLDGDLELDLQQPWQPPTQTASRWALEVLEYPEYVGSNMLVRVRLTGDGVPVWENTLLVQGSLWRDAWFSRAPLASGSIFDPSVLAAERVDFFRQRDALPAGQASGDMIFSRDIPPDRMLTWNDLAKRPLVHRGDIVEAVASEGMLYVTMKVLALENGARGDLVLVRNMESMKNISAQVIGDDRVEVHF